MQISMRAEYAARAITDLGQRYETGLSRGVDIAARQRIPGAFLEQLLTALRRAGLIRSVRGPTGGHELALAPSEITLADVLQAVEGPPTTATCMKEDGCTVTEDCVLQDIWRDLGAAYQEILSRVTIAELVRRQAERESIGKYRI